MSARLNVFDFKLRSIKGAQECLSFCKALIPLRFSILCGLVGLMNIIHFLLIQLLVKGNNLYMDDSTKQSPIYKMFIAGLLSDFIN